MSLNFIQKEVFDQPGALFPGQIADFGSSQAHDIRTYINDTIVAPGEAVVEGVLLGANEQSVRTPFTIKRPEAGSVDVDFVGFMIRIEALVVDDVTNEVFRPAKSLLTLAERGSGIIIGIPTTVTITHNDNVFMSVDAAAAPFLPVGQLTNAAAAGVVLLTGSKWYGAAAANTVARIKA